jgi:NADPH:quinone reductase-like Zn-dependent oxidoreductase
VSHACVLTEYGPPDVLKWEDVPLPEPSEGQIRIKVRVSGVGPTDLKIRHGDVKGIFALPEPPVLGFETAGTVDAVGEGATGVAVGDEVAALLPSLGGYGEYALAAAWTPKPPDVTWNDAGALPASVEAAVGVLRQLRLAEGERVGERRGSAPFAGRPCSRALAARRLARNRAASVMVQGLTRGTRRGAP